MSAATAKDLCTVAYTETGIAVILDGVGIVVGRKTRRLYGAADLQTLNGLGGGNVTVDKHARHRAGSVLHIDGLHKTVRHGDGRHGSPERDQLALCGAVVELRCGDLDGLNRCSFAHLFDLRHLKLRLTLIGIRRAGNAHDVAQLELARHREAVDATGGILYIDAVKERRLLVIAGGVGGHDTLDGELEALFALRAYLRNGADMHGSDGVEQIFAERVVGVFCGKLQIIVVHERGTGNEEQSLALRFLHCHDQQALIVLRESILRCCIAAQAVAVGVLGDGRAVGKQDGGHGSRQRGERVSVLIHRVNARAAVVADAAGQPLSQNVIAVSVQGQHKSSVLIGAVIG